EVRWVEGGGDTGGERRGVLVHDGNGGLVQGLRDGGGGDVDRHGEGEDDQRQHGGVAGQAPELLHSEAVDVGEGTRHGGFRLPVSSAGRRRDRAARARRRPAARARRGGRRSPAP